MSTRLNHEMRDPLAVIFAGIQSLQGSPSLSAEDSAGLELVLGAARSIVSILNRFVDSSHSGAIGLTRVPVDQLLKNCIRALDPTAAARGVSLEVIPGPEQIELLIDEQAMSRAIKNLIQNSLEASGSGYRVKIGWRELGESEKRFKLPGFSGKVVGIYGEDSGRGLPSDLSETSIFRPFVTTKSSGTGLGLSVAQEIIELQGGVISLVSLSTGGSAFEILLPADPKPGCREAASDMPACEDCEIKRSAPVNYCWAVKGRDHRAETGFWLQRCLGCSFFKSVNLSAHFVHIGQTSGKE